MQNKSQSPKRRRLLKHMGALFAGLGAIPLANATNISAPLAHKKPYPILRTHTAGFHHYHGADYLAQLSVGDALQLARQPNNPYDSNAIEVYWNSIKLAYVPRVCNAALSSLLERGEPLSAHLTWIDTQAYEPIGFDVFLWV